MKIKKDVLTRMIRESITKCLNETTFSDLDDMDNYSWQYSRGERFDIYVDGHLEYHDIPEESVDRICDMLERAPYEQNIEVKRIGELSEERDIDADTYYGGGLPEPAQHAMTYTPEKEVAEICEQMRPYVDKLADVFNSYSPTVQGVDDKVFTLLNGFDELPKLAKFFSTTEID
jgi:hypothetical protein